MASARRAGTYIFPGWFLSKHARTASDIDVGVSVIVLACSNTDRFSCLINWFAANDKLSGQLIKIDRIEQIESQYRKKKYLETET